MENDMDMEQIEADFGINLKDILLTDILMRLGDVEYHLNSKKGTWKTKVESQNDEKFEMDDKEKGFDQKKKKKAEEGENLNIQDMQTRIQKFQLSLKNTQDQITDYDEKVQAAREKLKKVKLHNDKLTYAYIDEHLETELLIQQAQNIIQIKKEIKEEEEKL